MRMAAHGQSRPTDFMLMLGDLIAANIFNNCLNRGVQITKGSAKEFSFLADTALLKSPVGLTLNRDTVSNIPVCQNTKW